MASVHFAAFPNSPYYEFIDELPEGREATPWNALGPREYIRNFLVGVRDNRMASIAVLNCPGMPLPYSPYQSGGGLEYDLAALLVRYDIKQRTNDDWSQFTVRLVYSTDMPDGGPIVTSQGVPVNFPGNDKGAQNNPELEPPDIEWDFEVSQQTVDEDLDGFPLVNSADVPFMPSPTFEIARPVLLLSRNEVKFDSQIAEQYSFAVNEDSFLGAKPGQAQCLPPKAKLMFRGRLKYWRVSYRIRFKREKTKNGLDLTWQPRILDRGMDELVDLVGPVAPGEPTKILVPIMSRGQRISQPVLLDLNGHQSKKRQGEKKIPAFYHDFRIYKKKSFKKLLSKGLT